MTLTMLACPISKCERTNFAGSGALDEHLRTRHRLDHDQIEAAMLAATNATSSPVISPPSTFPCNVPGCDKSFPSAQGRAVHVGRNHPELRTVVATNNTTSGIYVDVNTTGAQPTEPDPVDDGDRYELTVLVDADELALIETECFLNQTTIDDWHEQLINTQLAALAKDRTIRKILEYRATRNAE